MDLKSFDRLVAEEFQAVAALDQRDALSSEALEFDRSHFRAVLLALALMLRLLVVVELAFDAIDGAMEQVDRRPEQIVEVRLKPRAVQGRNQGVEDVRDRAGDDFPSGSGLGSGWSSKRR